MKIKYISYGKQVTGGYLHEQFFANSLCKELSEKHPEIDYQQVRFPQLFIGFFAYLQLQWKAFKSLHADIGIVVSRLAWIALIKRIFNKKFKAFVVFHHLDWSMPSSIFFRLYIQSFLLVLHVCRVKHIAVVLVSPFWLKKVQSKYPNLQSFLFPNLFNPENYSSFQSSQKSNSIHLGQWGWKNDPAILDLAKQLHQQGFSCYFSSNNPEEQCQHEFYEIVCEERNAYLKRMAAAQWTLALSVYQEGWNRIAHESLLVGTPVIGYAHGGLSDLLFLSHAKIVKSTEEAYQLICQHRPENANHSNLIEQFHINQTRQYLQPILHFLG